MNLFGLSKGTIRLLVFLTVFFLTVYMLLSMKLWSHDWTRYFFLTDRWVELIFVFLGVYFVSELLMKLLLWFAKTQVR